jgi:serine protease Do
MFSDNISKNPNRSPKRDVLLGLVVILLAFDLGSRVLLAPEVLGQEKPTAGQRREGRRDATVRAVMKAGQAVANISTERVVKTRRRWGRLDVFEEFFEGFLPDRGRFREQKTRSLGSGIIIDGSGYILTNAHVVAQASRIVVTLKDNKSYQAELVNLSEDDDLALLKVEAKQPLPSIVLGLDDLMIGETVIALGNPFGLENTVTRGVVSARDRRIVRSGKALPGTFLQTDAAINPGNSGGPLINVDAELIGINTAVHATGQGIGFAIPIGRIREVLNRLSNIETLTDYWLGVTLKQKGARIWVSSVVSGSPADQANLSKGDVLRVLAGKKLGSIFDFNKIMLKNLGGKPVTLDLERGGKLYRTALTMATKPSVALIYKRLGLQVETFKPRSHTEKEPPSGVRVKKVRVGSPGAKIGVEAGDIIIKVGRIIMDPKQGRVREIFKIVSAQTLAGFLEQRPPGSEVIVYVMRGRKELVGEVKLR